MPEIKIVILTVHHSPEHIHAAMKLGANAFLTKDLSGDSLLSALKKVAQGEVVFSDGVAHACAQEMLRSVTGRAEPDAEDLSRREIEIISGIAQGLSNKEIAASLGLSVRTVITHRERLGRKLSLRGTAQITAFALKHGMLGEGDIR